METCPLISLSEATPTRSVVKVLTGRPGRPREFDINVTTRAAMELFWQNGFHATSLPDLIDAMSLTRGSIYKAYEDKRSIYLAALDVYVEERLATFKKDLTKKDKRAAISDALRRAGRNSASEEGRRGCFATAATAEMVPNDSEVEDRVASLYRGLQRLFTIAIDEGKRAGSIASKTPTTALAQFLVCTIQGMCILGKLGRSERSMASYINVALSLLD